jgi:hypothetical protein
MGSVTDTHRVVGRRLRLWAPKTYGELFDAYRQMWQYLRQQIDQLPEEERSIVAGLFLQHARHLGRIQNLADMVLDTIHELLPKPYLPWRQALETVEHVLRYDRESLPPGVVQRWEQIRDQLVGSDFASRLRRYVGLRLTGDWYDKGRQ